MAEKLRREVEPPQRHQTGLGVMLIASAAMFFAVAGSAFILRARMADSSCPRSQNAPAPPSTITIRPMEPASPGPGPGTCGGAVYRRDADGSTSVTYDLCPPGEVPHEPLPAVYRVSLEEVAE